MPGLSKPLCPLPTEAAPTILAAHPIVCLHSELRELLDRARVFAAGNGSYSVLRGLDARLAAAIAEA